MNFKLVVLLAFVATSQAYVLINTFLDSSCNESQIVAKFISSEPCAKRSAMVASCFDENGVYYKTECWETDPTPEGWQYVKYNANYCNFTASGFFAIAVPEPVDNVLVVTYENSRVVANVTFACNSSGVLTSGACKYFGDWYCTKFSLENGVCGADESGSIYGYSESCVAAPVAAEPVAEPIAAPLASPVAAPIKAPLKTPVATSSANSIVVGSVAVFLSLAAWL